MGNMGISKDNTQSCEKQECTENITQGTGAGKSPENTVLTFLLIYIWDT